MKTLLQINILVNSRSTGRIVEEIGQVAINNGWESYIAYGRFKRLSQSKLIRIGTDWDVKLHGLKSRFFDRHGLGSVKATKKLIAQIETIQPDIIHLHNLHGYYLNIEILFNYLANANIPVVWTLHDCWPITGHCTYFDFVNCNKWENLCFQCPQKKEYPASFFFDRSTKNYKLKKGLFNSVNRLMLVPVSQWLSNILKQSYLNSYPTRVIHNGINTEVFKPQITNSIREKYKVENKFILLGVASGWSLRKGLKDFIKLSQMLNADYQIILIGLSKGQIKNLPSNVITLKKTENTNELAKFYAGSNVFVNPTYEDNFPTTNLEALACGTPVVTYKTGGSPEAIDEKTGIVVEKGDIAGLIDAIRRIKEKGKAYYSDACRERAVKYYNKDDRYMDYIKLYESILTKNGSPCRTEETQCCTL